MPLKNQEKSKQTMNLEAFGKVWAEYNSQKEDRSFNAKLARIMQATNSTSDAELARALGIQQPSVWGAKKNGKIPDSWIKKVSNKYMISSDWLYNGGPDYKNILYNALKSVVSQYGPPITNKSVEELVTKLAIKDFAKFNEALTSPQDNSTQIDKYVKDSINNPSVYPTEEQSPPVETDVDMMFVPLVEARLSAGTGSLETSADGERKYAFRSDFLHRKGSPNKMVLMRVSGDSMEPEIKDGDVVLLDQGKTTILPGRMYAVGIEEAIYVKQIDTIPGKLILKSMNQAYPPIEVDMRGDLAEQARVIGQVLWVGREYR